MADVPRLEIRPARPGDDLGAAGRLVQAGYFGLPDYPRDGEYDEIIADVPARAHEAEIVLGFLDGRLAGCLTYVSSHTNPHAEHGDPGAASFRYFAVDPAAQGSGLGRAMVQWVIDRARADGRERVRIHTLTMMHGAQRLYESMGFVRDTAHDEDWDGIVGLGYVLHLDPPTTG